MTTNIDPNLTQSAGLWDSVLDTCQGAFRTLGLIDVTKKGEEVVSGMDALLESQALDKKARTFKIIAIVAGVLLAISALALVALFVPPVAGIAAGILGGALLGAKFGAMGATALFGLGSLSFAIGSAIASRAAIKIME